MAPNAWASRFHWVDRVGLAKGTWSFSWLLHSGALGGHTPQPGWRCLSHLGEQNEGSMWTGLENGSLTWTAPLVPSPFHAMEAKLPPSHSLSLGTHTRKVFQCWIWKKHLNLIYSLLLQLTTIKLKALLNSWARILFLEVMGTSKWKGTLIHFYLSDHLHQGISGLFRQKLPNWLKSWVRIQESYEVGVRVEVINFYKPQNRICLFISHSLLILGCMNKIIFTSVRWLCYVLCTVQKSLANILN